MPATPPRPAVFAIPGDIETRTGGFIYERSLLHALRDAGRDVRHLTLPGSFPDAPPEDMQAAIGAMRALPADLPLIVDGLVFGAADPDGMATIRAPMVAMIHHPLALESGLSPARAEDLRQREMQNLTLAAHVVVPSPHTARILEAQYGVAHDRISVASPGFRAADPSRQPETPPLILAVGILVPRKGHDVLLEALARIADLPWRADIVGPDYFPATAAALRRQCDGLGLHARVTFTGTVDEAALIARYRRATVFALASRYEGYGMVFSEALLHGLPIVACRAGAIPDTVPEAAGLLVPPDDPGAFAEALRRVLTDQPLRERMATAATRAGQLLPVWSDTARVMGRVLDRVATGAG